MNFDQRWLQFEINHGPQPPGAKEDALFWYNAGASSEGKDIDTLKGEIEDLKRDLSVTKGERDRALENSRKTVLLRAAYDLLTTANRSHYVLSCNEITVRYDEANCDGMCLRDDLASELDIDTDTDPIPLGKEDK